MRRIGIEGTNSQAAGLARHLMSQNVKMREFIRPRKAQRRRGKSEPTNAYAAARRAQAEPDALPVAETGDGFVEHIRALLAVRHYPI